MRDTYPPAALPFFPVATLIIPLTRPLPFDFPLPAINVVTNLTNFGTTIPISLISLNGFFSHLIPKNTVAKPIIALPNPIILSKTLASLLNILYNPSINVKTPNFMKSNINLPILLRTLITVISFSLFAGSASHINAGIAINIFNILPNIPSIPLKKSPLFLEAFLAKLTSGLFPFFFLSSFGSGSSVGLFLFICSSLANSNCLSSATIEIRPLTLSPI